MTRKDSSGSKPTLSRRRFLISTVVVVIAGGILTNCQGLNGIQGTSPSCNAIRQHVTTDNATIQTLRHQKASTSDQAKKAQIDTQIAGIKQDIVSSQQQAQQQKCP